MWWVYLLRPIRWFIDWWAGLDPWLRIGIPIVLLGVSLVFLLFGRIFFLGWILGGLLLLFSGKSDAEKKGYHF